MAQKQAKVLEVPTYIKNTSKFLSLLNKNLAAAFALKLFESPIKYKLPKRELKMYEVSHKTKINLTNSGKEITVYENKFGDKKVLLVHGWNGRGTQLVTIAKAFKDLNYTIISFDAPGHGLSEKSNANMTHFIEAIFDLDKKYNGFDLIIGHSLGGMSIINSLSRGLKTQKAVIIGSGNKTYDITKDFLQTIGMSKKLAPKLIHLFEQRYHDKMEHYDVDNHAKFVDIPVLVIHDKDDADVPYTAAHAIYKNLQNGELMITEGLGHRKILGDEKVVEKIIDFATNF